jgi:mannose-1-phosphate guanylyltransferase/phosphomannomutase
MFLGRGTRIKGGVVIHGPTVVRPFTIIDNRAHIDRCIIWRNAYIGEDVELRGAIIGTKCSLKRRAVVFEGPPGDDLSQNGHSSERQSLASKEAEAGATCAKPGLGAQAKRNCLGDSASRDW